MSDSPAHFYCLHCTLYQEQCCTWICSIFYLYVQIIKVSKKKHKTNIGVYTLTICLLLHAGKMLPAGSSPDGYARFKDSGDDSQLPLAGCEVLNTSIEVMPGFIFYFCAPACGFNDKKKPKKNKKNNKVQVLSPVGFSNFRLGSVQ